MTLKKVFNDISLDGLKEYGFQYNKKYGAFMKFITDELIGYIAYSPKSSLKKGYKVYTVYSGVLSVYCDAVSKDKFISDSIDIIHYGYYFFNEKRLFKDPFGYYYNNETIFDSVKEALADTERFIIPVLNDIVDLNTYIAYRKRLRSISALGWADRLLNDSLSLIKADNHDDFLDLLWEETENLKNMFNKGLIGGTYEEQYNLFYDGIINCVPKPRDVVYSNPEMYNKAVEEAERRKEANLLTLSESGLELPN